eukprot:TRINITY_DN48711_c0_g1_i1.p3 TRINITY_DN48711_c0_g1~~TRINITY_DN48711_c0_g1_i1.p3  ORF type:complete len:173 (-),score=39.32 TRINITY_DN48711_c0_g1_i1:40-558(-)
MARSLTPSPRGELEITDINKLYLKRGDLEVQTLGRGYAWLDMGTHESLHGAASFVRAVQERQGYVISSPEEIAYRMGFIDGEQLKRLACMMSKNSYGQYLLDVVLESVKTSCKPQSTKKKPPFPKESGLFRKDKTRGEGSAFSFSSDGPRSCLLYTSPSPRDRQKSRMPYSA